MNSESSLIPDQRRCRERMVREHLLARGVDDPRVVAAMSTVRRHLFVDEALQGQAYGPNALPIGCGQTISQPYVVGMMTMYLQVQSGHRVLEIGTGSAYQAAVLAEMGADVFSVERIRPLYRNAWRRLQALGYHRVRLKLDDGTMGWPEEAPFDRILVTAGGPEIPVPLLSQLADQGVMLVPVGIGKRQQRLVRLRKDEGKVFKQELGNVSFVDLVGSHGW